MSDIVKILLLAPHPFFIDRGTPIDVDLMLRALSELGHQVDAVVYGEGEDRDYPGLRIHRVAKGSWARGMRPGFSIRKLLADVLLFFRSWRLVRTRSFDVVHAGEEAVFFAMFYQALHGLPYVYDMDSSLAQQMVERFGWLRPLAPLFNRAERAAIRGAQAVAPVCNALADLARERGAHEIVTLHDISRFVPSDFEADGSLRRTLGVDALMLMYVGNLERYQGVDLLLEALAVALRRGVSADLVIAGGSERNIERYREQAEGLDVGDRVHFIGPWPYEHLPALLAAADILTAPRIKGINTPMKVFPYLHSGRPVLVTDLPTHSQILHDEVAELAAPDPEGFADAIQRLAEDPDRREQLGRAGRQFVEEAHTYPAHRARVEALYRALASSSGDDQDLEPALSNDGRFR